MSLIDRQAAIDELNVDAELLRRVLDDTDVVGAERAKYEWGLGLIESYISDMKELPSAEPQWIPCSERMPEDEEEVLVTRHFLGVKDIPASTYVEVAQMYEDGTWCADSDEYKLNPSRHTNPIAWMPLPKPYKAGEQE